MLRGDFDSHIIWARLDNIKSLLDSIRQDHVAAELNPLETISFVANHIAAFKEMASTAAPLFTPAMLQPVDDQLVSVESSLNYRNDNGAGYPQYIDAAREQIEAALLPMAPWPRPYGRGGQVVQQQTLFEDLLETQRRSIEALIEIHNGFKADIDAFGAEAAQVKSEVVAALERLQASAEEAGETVDAEKARVDEVISNGISKIGDLKIQFDSQYSSWTVDREESFRQRFDPFASEIEAKGEVAHAALEKLQVDEEEYVNLTSAVAAGEMAKHFQAEARNSRWLGFSAYVIGLIFIVAGSLPLINLALNPDPNSDQSLTNWTHLVTRLAVAAAGVTAATVVLRLGASFIRDAGSSKRMELELRTFGPFLASVGETERVDSARIEWVTRTFGIPAQPAAQRGDDVIEVSTFSKLIDSISKLLGR